jgi:tetrahydromethanopterin S-methyltransferase subunit C
MTDYSFLAIDLLGLVTIVGIGYYASKILIQMRTGLLERSWRYLVAAAYVLLGGVFAFLVQQFATSAMVYEVTSHLSAVLLVIGGIYILLGFRAHYVVFSPKHPKVDMSRHIEK